jgi:hypothetical protein
MRSEIRVLQTPNPAPPRRSRDRTGSARSFGAASGFGPIRHGIEDWNAGASVAATPRYLARTVDGLGLLWQTGRYGKRGYTLIREGGVGPERLVDLRAIWSEEQPLIGGADGDAS